METNFRRVSVGYNQAGLIGGTEYNTEDWLNYQVAEDLPVSVGVVAGREYVSNNQDQTYEQLRVRARYSYTEKLAFDVSGGGELRQFQSGNPQSFSPVFSVAATYNLAVRTTLSLVGSEQKYASDLNGYNYTSTGATFEVSQGITDRFTANFSVGYYALDYAPVVVHWDRSNTATTTTGQGQSRCENCPPPDRAGFLSIDQPSVANHRKCQGQPGWRSTDLELLIRRIGENHKVERKPEKISFQFS